LGKVIAVGKELQLELGISTTNVMRDVPRLLSKIEELE
jgi:hypothetical protein